MSDNLGIPTLVKSFYMDKTTSLEICKSFLFIWSVARVNYNVSIQEGHACSYQVYWQQASAGLAFEEDNKNLKYPK